MKGHGFRSTREIHRLHVPAARSQKVEDSVKRAQQKLEAMRAQAEELKRKAEEAR